MRVIAALLVVLLAVGGAYFYFRADPLTQELNKRWPPLNADQQRQKAVDATAASLLLLPHPNIAAGVDIKTIEQVTFEQLKSRGASKLTVTADRQLLRVVLDFDRTFSAADLPVETDKRDLVNRLSPHVTGQVDLFLGAAATLVADSARTIQIKLLPAVHSAHIDKITLANNADLPILADVITFLVNRYADNLASALSDNPLLDLTLPTTLQDSFDPSGPIKIAIPSAPDIKFTLSSKPIKSPFGLASVAWLIDGNELSVMGQLVPTATMPSSSETASSTFDSIKAGFQKQLKDGLDISAFPAGVWAALGKSLLATSLDNAFDQASPCFTAQGPIPKESFSQKISIPDGSDIDCTPTKRCDLHEDQRDCRKPRNCTHNHDERDCSQCLASAFGHCITHGNNPFCEAAKATQNVGYDAAFNACNALGPIDDLVCEGEKAAQNKLYEADKFKCETEKTTLKGACETAKGTLMEISHSGNFANIDGNISGRGDVKLCFLNVHFSEKMDSLSLNLQASGSAGLDTHFKFVPLDVVGHLACPAEWTADKTIGTQIPQQSVPLSLTLSRQMTGGKQSYNGTVDEFPIKLHFQPSPLSLVLQNINFYLACGPAAGLINGLTLNLGPFIPELLKDYTYKQKPISFSFTPDLPLEKVMGHSIKPALSETALAILFTGAL